MKPLILALLLPTLVQAREDIILADFESPSFGEWKSTGKAFGDGPAAGKLKGQMDISGFEGKSFANSYHGGDGTTGTLTSPTFTINHKHLNFLIGGGKDLEKLALQLLIDGKPVLSATGTNDKPGGSENLNWDTLDLSPFQGKSASLRIVDQATGGWGHITIDQITLADKPKQSVVGIRGLQLNHRYLHVPIKNGAPKVLFQVFHEKDLIRTFTAELATGEDIDFTAVCDLRQFIGKEIVIRTGSMPEADAALRKLIPAPELPDADNVYLEAHRPGFHFTSKIGWLNDPNGLVFQNGIWHLFYQHNPFGIRWGNMHWGHAVSSDLFRWKELGDVFFPGADTRGMAFSGSAVIDSLNTSGWGKGALVTPFTDTGLGEVMAYSLDRGQTFAFYENNPVVKHKGRDPKVFWHAPSKHWVMAVYNEDDGKKSIRIHRSPDLKNWTFESENPDFYECPELFEIPIDGKPGETKWIMYGADTEYLVGTFDGMTFVPDSTGKTRFWQGSFYASQLYNNTPDDRLIQIGWARGTEFPGMPFSQQMAVPVELALRETPDGFASTPPPPGKSKISATKPSKEPISIFQPIGKQPSISKANSWTSISPSIRRVPDPFRSISEARKSSTTQARKLSPAEKKPSPSSLRKTAASNSAFSPTGVPSKFSPTKVAIPPPSPSSTIRKTSRSPSPPREQPRTSPPSAFPVWNSLGEPGGTRTAPPMIRFPGDRTGSVWNRGLILLAISYVKLKFALWDRVHSRQVKAMMPDSIGDFRVRLSRLMWRSSGSNSASWENSRTFTNWLPSMS